MTTKRVALGGLLLALALIVSWAESLIPPPIPAVPGIKLGLANVIVLVVMYRFGAKLALPLNAARVLLAGFIFTGLWGMAYSMSGAMVSFAVMYALKRSGKFSVLGVSAAGGVFHNLAQLILAAAALGDARLMYYYPVLILSGLICGAITGL
ncbi:MAG: Gx transporter family protein, partial [Oscillospiraceae bacterium]|nr:Gx transporter family protein [Oscillospiraceae bacterium]